jgi:hypothetical protein
MANGLTMIKPRHMVSKLKKEIKFFNVHLKDKICKRIT